MTVWSHLSTIFAAQRILYKICTALLCVVVITALLLPFAASAAPSREVISFSARLKNSTGGIVADGHYNIAFSLYDQASSGSPLWTESYHDANGPSAGQDNRVRVVNGYLNVKLGSLTAFSSNIDWNDDLWLTMNIGGTTQTTSQNITWDGEMTPRIQLSAVPYALNSTAVGGKTASQLVQLGQGTQTDSGNNASVAINKTGSGNLMELQSSGADIFTLSNTGSIELGSVADQSISVAQSSSGPGTNLTLSAGAAATASNLVGGNLILQGGAGDGGGGDGGVIVSAQNDNTSAFQVQNAAGESVLNVNTASKIVSVGKLNFLSGSDSGLGTSTYSLWDEGITSGGSFSSEGPLNLGITFKSSVAGFVSGVKFYNPAGGNAAGSDVGKLWACASATCSLGVGGTELASVSFPADTTEGWKTAQFSTPVNILPDTYYVVSYFTSVGAYRAQTMYFDNADRVNGPLQAMRHGVTENGSFAVGSAKFPTNTYERTNYWVDLVFQPATDIDQISSDNGLQLTSGGPMNIGTTGQSKLSLQGGSVDINTTLMTVNGDALIKADDNTDNTFRVQNTGGSNLLAVSASNNQIRIGSASTNGTVLVLGSRTTAGDPTGTAGAMYYSSAAGAFRCFEDGAWKNCVTPLPVSKITSTFTTPTSSATDVDGLDFQLAANTKYHYKFVIRHNTSENTTLVDFGVTTPSNPVMNTWCVNTTATTDAQQPGHWGAYCGSGDANTTLSDQGTGPAYTSTMEGYIETGNDAGALQLRAKAFGLGDAYIEEGSFGIVQVVQ